MVRISTSERQFLVVVVVVVVAVVCFVLCCIDFQDTCEAHVFLSWFFRGIKSSLSIGNRMGRIETLREQSM